MWREDVRMAARALRAHAFRSSLTVLGITVGAFAIVLMTSLAQSGLASLQRSFEELGGARLLMVTPKRPEKQESRSGSYTRGFTFADRDILFERVPHLRHAAMYAQGWNVDAFNSQNVAHRTSVLAGDAQTLKGFGLRLDRGRNLTDDDSREHARVCVVASDLAKALFEGDALGKWLNVDGTRCRVVGQLAGVEHWGMGFGFDWKNFVLLPLETWNDSHPGAVSNALFLLRTHAPEHNDLVKRVANALLLERHNGVDDFEFWDFQKVMKEFHVLFAVMQAIVGLIAGIALLVGGIGVMNMMLVSVSERVREIGIRKALGARQGDIQRQFLLEASMLAGTGGAMGVGLGMVLAVAANLLITHLKPSWVSQLSVPAIVVALVVSCVLGVGFGFFPARRAARLDPVEAIRA